MLRLCRGIEKFSLMLEMSCVTFTYKFLLGSIHTMKEKFEDKVLFLRLSLPSTLMCHENGQNALKTFAFSRGLKTELFENDGVTISM